MIKILKTIGWLYAVAGAIWLTFTLCTLFFLHRPEVHNIDGVVKEIVVAEWDGYRDDIALVQTDDGNGNVLARDYRNRVKVGDSVSLEISAGGVSGSYIHTSIQYRSCRAAK